MIRSRFYLVGLALVTSLLASVFFFSSQASAAGEIYVWDGNDILAIKGEYTKPVKYVLREDKYYSPAMDIPVNNDKRASCSSLPKGDVSIAVGVGVEIGGGDKADTRKNVLRWPDSDQSGKEITASELASIIPGFNILKFPIQTVGNRQCFVSIHGASTWGALVTADFDGHWNGIQDRKELNFDQRSQLWGEKGKSFQENCKGIPSIAGECDELLAQAAAAGNSGSEDETESQCKVDGWGWVICPMLLFFAKMTDGVYGIVENLLQVQPLSLDVANNPPQYVLWSNLRNFANIAFVLVFLIIIFSQVTGKGFNNYNIKKLLPRLVIAAILMNVSYVICAIAIDISNIVGANLKDLIEGAGKGIAPGTLAQNDGKVAVGAAAIGTATALVATALAGKAAIALVSPQLLVYALVGFVLPLLLAGFLAIVTVLIVLAARQAIIVLLVALSPLAFVAFLLPNTMKWYEKWQKLFIVMLVMYPMVALIFAASKVASELVVATNDGFIERVFGVGIATIPLFIVPVLLKSGGGALDRFGLWSKGMAKRNPLSKWGKSRFGEEFNRPGSKLTRFNAGKRIAEGGSGAADSKRRKFRRFAGNVLSGRQLDDMERKRQDALDSRDLFEEQSDYFKASGGVTRVSGGDSGKAALVEAGLSAEAKKAFDELTSAFMHNNENKSIASLQEMVKNPSSSEEMAAAAALIARSNDSEANATAWESIRASGNREVISSYVDELSRNKPAWLGEGQLASMRTDRDAKDEKGNYVSAQRKSMQQMAAETVASGGMSGAEKLAGTHPSEIDFAHNSALSEAMAPARSKEELAAKERISAGLQGMAAGAQRALTDERISGKITKNRGSLERIASGIPQASSSSGIHIDPRYSGGPGNRRGN